MTKDTFQILAKYNRAANEKMNEVIKTLPSADWEKQFPAFFKSVRAVCSHIFVADFTWLKRFGGLREFTVLKDRYFEQPYSFKEVAFPEKSEYFSKRAELDAKIGAFVEELTEEDLQSPLNYQDSSGNPYTKNFGGCLLHTFNHETHHRGMISLYLELLGKDNDFNSISPVL
jgi:uncharacterized damage-inducible protein DinB